MIPPNEPDPHRSLRDATRVSRVLGGLLLLAGAIWMVPVVAHFDDYAADPLSLMLYLAAPILLFFGPATLYLVAAPGITRGQRGLTVLALVVAAAQLLLACFIAAAVIAFHRPGSGLIDVEIAIAIVLTFSFEVVYLINALRAMKRPEVNPARGFEPVICHSDKSRAADEHS